MGLIFEENIKPYKSSKTEFINKVLDVSKKLDINPNWLMAVMNSESRLDSTIQNTKYPVGGGYATGLIQFIPSTAKGLGTSTDELKNMSSVKQLDYVYKYFLPYKNKIVGYQDLYMVTFFPAAVGKSDSTILEAKNIPAAKIATSNPIFDLNKDNKITVKEVREAFLKRIPENLRTEFKEKYYTTTKIISRNPLPFAIGAVVLVSVIGYFVLIKNKK